MNRAFRLYAAVGRSVINKLVYDLAREVTVAISSLILIATFIYVFNDFLNVEIASLSQPMRDLFAYYLAATLLFLVAGLTGRCMRRDINARRSLGSMAFALGDSPNVLKIYHALTYGTLIALMHALAWGIVRRWLVRSDLGPTLGVEGLMLIVTTLFFYSRQGHKSIEAQNSSPLQDRSLPAIQRFFFKILALGPAGKRQTLCNWRLEQILFSSRPTRLALGSACLFFLLTCISMMVHLPPFIAAVASLVGGLLVALCLAFQIAEDLEYSWFERCLGVSHDDFIAGYERAALVLAFCAAAITFLFFILGVVLGSTALSGDLLTDGLKAAVVAAVPCLVAPGLLLQIDGRKVFVTGLTLLIVSLFVGTAALAHWLSLALIPLLRYFAKNSQAGRFYRA